VLVGKEEAGLEVMCVNVGDEMSVSLGLVGSEYQLIGVGQVNTRLCT